MSNTLINRVAVITGGGDGVGLGIAEALLEAGAHVVLTGRTRSKLDAAVSRLGEKAEAVEVDAASPEAMQSLFEDIKRRHGSLDIFVANAAVGEHAPLAAITEDQADRMFATNYKGIVFSIKAAAALMPETGSIILIGSTASVAAPKGMSIYGGLKAALRGSLEAWVKDLAGTGIRINVLSPGAVDTPSLRGAFAKAIGADGVDAQIASISDRSPLRRIGSAREIGEVAAFLAGPAASYVNGVELFVDGGLRQV
jgi:NAD(P)-dependent dehydrogenase (short-subunit alcohol dehydrogenase family)